MDWIITENEECLCPGFTVDLLPHQVPAKLRVLYRDTQVYLEADGLAGVVPCKSGNNILIMPKCRKLNPLLMYEYINNLSAFQLDEQDIDYTGKGIDITTLATHFAKELIAIQCRQKLIKRLPVKKTSSSIKGHIDWPATSRLWAMGRKNEIYSTTNTSTFDIPENEIISMAAATCMPLFDVGTDEWKALRSWSMIPYKNDLSKEDLLKLQWKLKTSQLSGAHAYYYIPICLALVILGVDDAGNMNSNEQAILFNMPGLFENYIRTAFLRKSVLKGYSCQKSFVPRSFLFSDGSCELEPDITIYSGSTIKAVLDVKYKVPDSKDYYQLFTYMRYAQLDEAYIISPFVKHLDAITAYDGGKIINLQVDESDHLELETMVSSIVNSL